VIILAVLFLVLFGLAAGVSVFLTNTYLKDQSKAQRNDTAQDSAREPPPLARGGGAGGEGGSRARPGSTPESEQGGQGGAKLHEREQAVIRLERQVTQRQKFLETIKDDIKSEREEIEKLRKDVAEQVKGAGDELALAEKRIKDLEQKKKEEEGLLKEVK